MTDLEKKKRLTPQAGQEQDLRVEAAEIVLFKGLLWCSVVLAVVVGEFLLVFSVFLCCLGQLVGIFGVVKWFSATMLNNGC